MLKSDLRRHCRSVLSQRAVFERSGASILACDRLSADLAWRQARCLLVFMAAESEMDTAPLIETAFAEGKHVFVPRIDGSNLVFHRIFRLDGPFEIGPFGIREPLASAPRWNPSASPQPALAIVPGMAFDGRGNRLGRGGGYYDRFLARVRREAISTGREAPQCLGCGYEKQFLDELPVEAHDEPLDGLVTEVQVRRF